MEGNLRVEQADGVVVATLIGQPTEIVLQECQQRVLQLVGSTAEGRVLYDARALVAPSIEMPWVQRKLDDQAGTTRLRRAIVVSSTKIGFLARLAFGEGNYRVFYDDVAAAVNWLKSNE